MHSPPPSLLLSIGNFSELQMEVKLNSQPATCGQSFVLRFVAHLSDFDVQLWASKLALALGIDAVHNYVNGLAQWLTYSESDRNNCMHKVRLGYQFYAW